MPLSPVGKHVGRDYPDDLGHGDGQQSPGDAEQLPKLVPQGGDLVAEPLEEPAETALLGDAPDVFGWPFRGLSRGYNEVDEPPYLVDQQGQKDPRHEQQRHQHPEVGERYGQRALDQVVAPLEPVDSRVEHSRQEEGDDKPADEGAHLPEQEESAYHHRHGEQGDGDHAHHLRSRGAYPPSILAGYGHGWLRRCHQGSRLKLCLGFCSFGI